jgi:hypothetical protein
MAFYPQERLPINPDDPGTTPDAYVKQFIQKTPGLLSGDYPGGPVKSKKARGELALQGLVGAK